jgi:hypothetical protein
MRLNKLKPKKVLGSLTKKRTLLKKENKGATCGFAR